MEDFLTALALVLVIEGAIYALFPAAMKRAVEAVLDMPDNSLRVGGLIAAVIGVIAVWFIRG